MDVFDTALDQPSETLEYVYARYETTACFLGFTLCALTMAVIRMCKSEERCDRNIWNLHLAASDCDALTSSAFQRPRPT